MNTHPPTISFIVPLYNTGDALPVLLTTFRHLDIEESWELVLVDDGSGDETVRSASELLELIPAKVTLVELARNYGEHAAVLEGLRHAEGEFLVNLDDDLQNPVNEAVRLVRHLRQGKADVVYARYATKCHHWLRNLCSRSINAVATFLLEKPSDLYLSSFRAMRRDLAQRIVRYQGPYPYIDGLVLGATRRIERLDVEHQPRNTGASGYTIRKLVRLAMNVCFDSSIMPLRLASVLGLMLCGAGAIILGEVMWETLFVGRQAVGWGSLMGMLTVFSGAQLTMLGLIGEYVGRAFLTASGKPQSLVREVIIHHKN